MKTHSPYWAYQALALYLGSWLVLGAVFICAKY